LALLWMPIWNTLIIMPIGFMIGYGIDRSNLRSKQRS
jgi:hypothetical protein